MARFNPVPPAPRCVLHEDTPMHISVVYQTTATFRCWACKAQKLDTLVELPLLERPTQRQGKAIAANRRDGLLCACNAVKVPYHGTEHDGHGSSVVGGIKHGYTDCQSV